MSHLERVVERYSYKGRVNSRPSSACKHGIAMFGSAIKEGEVEDLCIYYLDIALLHQHCSELVGGIVCMSKHSDALTL